MGIDVAIVNERHEPLQEVFDPRGHLTKLAIGPWNRLSGSICLRFIDVAGDTVFNQAQLPILILELGQSAQEQADPLVRAHLEKVLRLIERAEGRVHIYVKFIGD